VVKKRVALMGRGKRSGARTPGFDDRQIAKALSAGEIVEVLNGNDEA
jgi:hypothetical protein